MAAARGLEGWNAAPAATEAAAAAAAVDGGGGVGSGGGGTRGEGEDGSSVGRVDGAGGGNK